MNDYNEIKQNLIEKFFNKHYRYTCAICKNAVISDMKNRLPFDIECVDDVLNVTIGNGIELSFKLTWECKEIENKILKKTSEYYRLVNIE